MSGREAACLRSFVHTLGQTERYVLLLFYADDLTSTEIGVVLQLPERRVLAILNRLRRQAHAVLESEKAQPGIRALA